MVKYLVEKGADVHALDKVSCCLMAHGRESKWMLRQAKMIK